MESISKCEEEVFLSIFRLNPDDAALQQILGSVNEKYKHEWKPQTVSTFLARLVRKNYLTMVRRGRYCYYTPTMSLKEYRLQSMRERHGTLFDGDNQAFVEYLRDIGVLKEQEIHFEKTKGNQEE